MTCPVSKSGVEATSPSGATVTWSDGSVVDTADNNPTLTCTPINGSTFGIANTSVTCYGTDSSGNISPENCTFYIQVQGAFGVSCFVACMLCDCVFPTTMPCIILHVLLD